MDKENASHIMVLTTLQGLCELAKTKLFKKIARTTISKTKDNHYFFESVAIHDWNCDPKSNPNNVANADNIHEFMLILKQQEYYDYVRFDNGGFEYGDDIVETLCSPEDTSFEKLEPARLTDFIKGTALIGRHILSTDEQTALGIV